MNNQRVATGITGLDEMLHGGFLEGSAVLLRGAPGTGKTSLALQFLVHGAMARDECGLLITFEEFPQSLHRDAQSLGWDLSRLEREGKLHLMFTSPEVLLASLQTPSSSLSQLLLNNNIQRVVVDSVSHFRQLSNDPQDLRQVYNVLVNGLKRERTTSLLIGEQKNANSAHPERGRLAYMVDVIILLRYVEIDSAIQRGVLVLKMRGSDHLKEIRRFAIEPGGLRIIGVFQGHEAILSGAPHWVGAGVPGG